MRTCMSRRKRCSSVMPGTKGSTDSSNMSGRLETCRTLSATIVCFLLRSGLWSILAAEVLAMLAPAPSLRVAAQPPPPPAGKTTLTKCSSGRRASPALPNSPPRPCPAPDGWRQRGGLGRLGGCTRWENFLCRTREKNASYLGENKNSPFEMTGHEASCPEAQLWPTDI